jgi:hypothetical protein
MVVASIALFVALGGVSYGLATGSIDSREIKNNTVRSKDVRNNNLRGRDVRNNSITGRDVRAIRGRDVSNDSLTGDDVLETSLGTVPSAARVNQVKTIGSYRRVASSASNADRATARAAATAVPLLSFGRFIVYGKCYTDTDNTALDAGTWADAFIRTTENGSVLDSNIDDLDGDPAYLNTSTLETDRELEDQQATPNSADTEAEDDGVFAAAAPDGTGITGQINLAAKNGNLPVGNALYGAGNACLFWGHAIG